MEDQYFNLVVKSDVSLNTYLSDGTEYEELITPIEAKIILEDHDEKRHEAGRVSCRIVELNRASSEGFSLFDLFDTEADLHHFTPILEDDFSWIRFEITELFSEEVIIGPSRLLVIDRLVLSPEYRGHDFGLKALKIIIAKLMSGEDLVVLSASPLQFRDDMLSEREKAGLIKQKKKATKKLINYYEKAGFVLFRDDGKSNIMIRHGFVRDV